jgi:hypothetical protein
MRNVRGDLDAMDLASALQSALPNRLGQSALVSLVATESGQNNLNTISSNFKQFTPSARAIDTVLFYAASHANAYSFVNGPTGFQIDVASDYVTKPSLTDRTLAGLLGLLPEVTRKVVILDVCHAGGIGDYLAKSLYDTSTLAACSASGTTASEPDDSGKGVFTDDLIAELESGVFDLNRIASDIRTDPRDRNALLIGMDLDLRDSGSAIFTGLQPELYESAGTPGRLLPSTTASSPKIALLLQGRMVDQAIQITIDRSVAATNAVALELSTNLRSWLQVGFNPAGSNNVVFAVPATNYTSAFFRAKLVD